MGDLVHQEKKFYVRTQVLCGDAPYASEMSRRTEGNQARYCRSGRRVSAQMPLQTRTACAYAYQTEIGSALAFRTNNAMVNVVQTTRTTASAFGTMRATVSAFWMRSVRAFAIWMQHVSHRRRVSRQISSSHRVSRQMWSGWRVPWHLPSRRGVSGDSSIRTPTVKANLIRMECAMASAF